MLLEHVVGQKNIKYIIYFKKWFFFYNAQFFWLLYSLPFWDCLWSCAWVLEKAATCGGRNLSQSEYHSLNVIESLVLVLMTSNLFYRFLFLFWREIFLYLNFFFLEIWLDSIDSVCTCLFSITLFIILIFLISFISYSANITKKFIKIK